MQAMLVVFLVRHENAHQAVLQSHRILLYEPFIANLRHKLDDIISVYNFHFNALVITTINYAYFNWYLTSDDAYKLKNIQ